jgi:hypothetical protein
MQAGFLRKVHLGHTSTYQGKDGLRCVSNSRHAGLIASARLVFRPEIFLVSIVPRIQPIGGYRPILVPGRDLMMVPGAVCSYRPQETISQAYLRCGLPATAAYAPI